MERGSLFKIGFTLVDVERPLSERFLEIINRGSRNSGTAGTMGVESILRLSSTSKGLL